MDHLIKTLISDIPYEEYRGSVSRVDPNSSMSVPSLRSPSSGLNTLSIRVVNLPSPTSVPHKFSEFLVSVKSNESVHKYTSLLGNLKYAVYPAHASIK